MIVHIFWPGLVWAHFAGRKWLSLRLSRISLVHNMFQYVSCLHDLHLLMIWYRDLDILLLSHFFGHTPIPYNSPFYDLPVCGIVFMSSQNGFNTSLPIRTSRSMDEFSQYTASIAESLRSTLSLPLSLGRSTKITVSWKMFFSFFLGIYEMTLQIHHGHFLESCVFLSLDSCLPK